MPKLLSILVWAKVCSVQIAASSEFMRPHSVQQERGSLLEVAKNLKNDKPDPEVPSSETLYLFRFHGVLSTTNDPQEVQACKDYEETVGSPVICTNIEYVSENLTTDSISELIAMTDEKTKGLCAAETRPPGVKIPQQWASIFGLSASQQSMHACESLKTKLQEMKLNGVQIVIIGESNGGVIARWVVQSCNLDELQQQITMSHFVSVVGPQRGITQSPKLPCDTGPLGKMLDECLQAVCKWTLREGHNMYLDPTFQKYIGPAGYVYDPTDLDAYKNWEPTPKSPTQQGSTGTFLAQINNEAVSYQQGGSDYNLALQQKKQVSQLTGMLLIHFTGDTVVVPKESHLFGQTRTEASLFAKRAADPLADPAVDVLGLGSLCNAKPEKLQAFQAPGNHDPGYPESRDIRQKVVIPFLTTGKVPWELQEKWGTGSAFPFCPRPSDAVELV